MAEEKDKITLQNGITPHFVPEKMLHIAYLNRWQIQCCLAGLCSRRTDDAELERSKNQCRSAKETLTRAAIRVDFCAHRSLQWEAGFRQADYATCVAAPVSIKLVTTLMLPCVAFEYGHSRCAPSTSFWATSRSIPGRLTLRRALNEVTAIGCAQVTRALITQVANKPETQTRLLDEGIDQYLAMR